MDSLQVLDAIEKRVVDQIDCVTILRQIMEIMDIMEVVVLSHVYRSANACADTLARRRCGENSFVYFDKAQNFLKSLLKTNAVGILVPTLNPI